MLVSILIPCFNAARWIGQAIDSALSQTWRDVEVIVVDDGSTDGSIEQIARFGNRIRWHSQPNQGSNPTRNRLLALARADWVQYLDADDYLLPGKIQPQAELAAAHPDLDVIYGPVTLEHVGERGRRLEPLPIPPPHDDWILLARWHLPQTGAPLWRRSAIEDVGGWRHEQPACQEHELYLRLLMAGKRFRYLDSNGAIYRQWSEHTLWKADQPRTWRLRLEIEERAETYLRDHQLLTPERRWAINMARFEMARVMWQVDRAEAIATASRIRASMPGFVPAGRAAPGVYRHLYRVLGFRAAETLASWARPVRTVLRREAA